MRRLKTVRRPPIYPNGAQAISPVAPSPLFRCPHAVHRCPSVDSGLENGKTAFVQSLAEGTVGWGSTEFIVMRAVQPVPPEFTYLLARDPTFRAHAIQSMTGTSGRQRVQVDALAPYLLPYPPAEIWAELRALFSPMFAQIELNRKASLSLATQRDTLLPGLVSGEMDVGKRLSNSPKR